MIWPLFALLGLLALGLSVRALFEAQRAASALLALRHEGQRPAPGQWAVLRGVIRCSSNEPPRSLDGRAAVFLRRTAVAIYNSDLPPGSEVAAEQPAAETSRAPVVDEVLFAPARLDLAPPDGAASYRSAPPEAPDAVTLLHEPLLLLDSPGAHTVSRAELERRSPALFAQAVAAAGGRGRLLEVSLEELALHDGTAVLVGGVFRQDPRGTVSLSGSDERPMIIALASGATPVVERALRCLAVALFGLLLTLAMWLTPAWWLGR